MALSSISAITLEGQPAGLSSFLRSGVLYVVWYSAINDTGLKRLHWKPHTGLDFTEVTPALGFAFYNMTALYHPLFDRVVVVWDDGTGQVGVRDGNIYFASFHVPTGTLTSGPTLLFPGSNPKLSYRGAPGDHFSLYYVTPKAGGVYGRLSIDGGNSWQSGEPIFTNKVAKTVSIEVVPYDSEHVSIAQLGSDTRGLAEIGMFARTRPLSTIVKHPTLANQFFVGEPSKLDNTTLIDNLRGGLVLSTDNTKLYQLVGARTGTDDGRGHLIKTTVTGTDFGSFVWPGFPAGANGDDLVGFTLAPALDTPNVELPGASYAVALDVSSTHGYVAEYADNSGTLGQFVVVDLSTGTTGTVFSGVTGVRAVAVANFLSPVLIFVASTESGVERLRVYQQNGLTPTLLLNTKLPARANALRVRSLPSPTSARLVVSMVDRLSLYDYTAAAAPVTLVDSFRFSQQGQFFGSRIATNGNIVVASGNAGVLVLSPTGQVKAQLQVSGKPVVEWTAATSFSTGQYVRPRARHQFARTRTYFRCTTTGTSGASEPAWAATGTILDSGAQWTAEGLVDGIVTDVALDETAKRIYAVGVAGGDLGTDGRVWILNAQGLL